MENSLTIVRGPEATQWGGGKYSMYAKPNLCAGVVWAQGGTQPPPDQAVQWMQVEASHQITTPVCGHSIVSVEVRLTGIWMLLTNLHHPPLLFSFFFFLFPVRPTPYTPVLKTINRVQKNSKMPKRIQKQTIDLQGNHCCQNHLVHLRVYVYILRKNKANVVGTRSPTSQ